MFISSGLYFPSKEIPRRNGLTSKWSSWDYEKGPPITELLPKACVTYPPACSHLHHLSIPAPDLQQRQDSSRNWSRHLTREGVLLLLPQGLLIAKGPSSSVQGKEKKKHSFESLDPGTGRGLHVEGPGIPTENAPSGRGGRDRDSLSNMWFPVCPRRWTGFSHPRK